MKATIILIVASRGYQPLEYGVTKATLEQAGITVLTASDKPGTAQVQDPRATNTGYETAHVDLLIDAIDPQKYDGIFLIGGPGALEHLNKPVTHALMQKMAQLNKPFGAICISPRILAQAGLLKHKHATGWDGDNQLASVFKRYGVQLVQESVVTDGTIVTATGPSAAQAFGKAITEVLKTRSIS